MKPTRVDVCIATRRRPRLLARLLASLSRQDLPEYLTIRVIVVDNDDARSAESVVADARSQGLELIYDVEPERNIALARNRAIAHATADFVATIDDDAHAPPDWLDLMVSASRQYDADIVLGAVRRELPPGAPLYLKNSKAFELPDPPTGTTEELIYNTINSLSRLEVLQRRPGPFDPDFGRTGGEDTELFYNLEHDGARLVWCSEAGVVESVLPERANLKWVLRRAFREGATYYRVYRRWDIKPSAPLFLRYFHLAAWGLRKGSLVIFHALWGIAHPPARATAVDHLRELIYQVGVAAQIAGLAGFEEYRD